VQQAELDFEHPNKASAHPYYPTRGRAFRKLFSSLRFPPDSVFVDYGSGKGKILLLAAECGFRKVIGIEFSEELHRIAQDNIRRYGGVAPQRVELVCADATAYVLHDDENVFYFFNPFEADVLAGVAAQIKASLQRRPRHIWVVFFDPRLVATLIGDLKLLQTGTFVYGGFEVVILENT
jgi:SAM-dependent methyltransferase